MLNIAAIVGSLRKDSYNRSLMQALDQLSHPDLTFKILDLKEIPIFNQDNENPLPAVVANFKQEILDADGVLFVTPEYNRSVPGMLKNVIDWGTRPAGKNAWKSKPMAVMGTSPGAIGTAVAQSHLRSIMTAIGGIMFPYQEIYLVYKPELVDKQNQITDPKTQKFLQDFLNSFINWVKQYPKH